MSRFRLARVGAESLGEAAARWALRLEDGPLNVREERAFAAWLDADAAHAAAFEDANWALDAPARHAAAPELLAIRSAALAARPPRLRRAWLVTGLAGGLAASFAALVTLTPLGSDLWNSDPPRIAARAGNPSQATYQTAIGERSAVTLPDGSVVTLDTDSRLRVAFTPTERGVHLLRGQALFDVAKATLPFAVQARNRRIVAVGTVFNVRLDGERVKVALIEGVIRVRTDAKASAAPSGPASPVRELVMTAGEVLDAAPLRQTVVRSDTEKVASWKNGLLMFNDTPLAEAVAEINRYTTHPIAIADASVGSYRVSGVFRSNDPERFSRAMADILPISVSLSPEGAPTLRDRVR